METIRKTMRITSQLFTWGLLIFCIFQGVRNVEKIYVIDIILFLATILIVVFGIILSRNLSLHNRLLNFLIPYLLVMTLLFIGIYFVNYMNLAGYIDFRLVGTVFTGGYLVYCLTSIYFIRKDRNRIHF